MLHVHVLKLSCWHRYVHCTVAFNRSMHCGGWGRGGKTHPPTPALPLNCGQLHYIYIVFPTREFDSTSGLCYYHWLA